MTTGNAWIQSVYQPLSHWVTQTHLVLLMPFQGCPLADVNGDGVEEFCGFQVRPSPQSTSQWHLVAYQGRQVLLDWTLSPNRGEPRALLVTHLLNLPSPDPASTAPFLLVCYDEWIQAFHCRHMQGPVMEFPVPACPVLPEEQGLWDQWWQLVQQRPSFEADASASSDMKHDGKNQENQGDESVFRPLLTQFNDLLQRHGSANCSHQAQYMATKATWATIQTLRQPHNHGLLKTPALPDYITACTLLPKVVTAHRVEAFLCLGTERGRVSILACNRKETSAGGGNGVWMPDRQVEVGSAIVLLAAHGSFDVQYYLFVACRDQCIYAVTEKSVSRLVQLEYAPVYMTVVQDRLLVYTTHQKLTSYSLTGTVLDEITLTSPITAMSPFHYTPRNLSGVVIATEDKRVIFYREQGLYPIHTLETNDVIETVVFGSFNRERDSMVMIERSGGLDVRVLKRSVQLGEKELFPGPPKEQEIPLPIPAKTKLFLDQRDREKKEFREIHTVFQRDLMQLKLETMRTYWKHLQQSMGSRSLSDSNKVKLDFEILGLGPVFKLNITLQNDDASYLTRGLLLAVHHESDIYRVEPALIHLPSLVPGVLYQQSIQIKWLSKNPRQALQGQPLRIHLMDDDTQTRPLSLHLVDMPIPQILEESFLH